MRYVLMLVNISGITISEAFAQMEKQSNIYDVVHVKSYDKVFSANLF